MSYTDNMIDEDIMLGYWYKEYADKGHWFNYSMTKCVRCGCPTIDLYEDGVYGEIRSCIKRNEI